MNEEFLLVAAHLDPDVAQVSVPVPPRALPRHRARRRAAWKPSLDASGLQAIEAQHAYDGNSLVG